MPEGIGRSSVLLNWLHLERRSATPLYRQIADQLRGALIAGRIPDGATLPASRRLAADLGVSRITTTQAYEQLTAEGLLETRRGAGTRVAALGDARRPAVPVPSPPFMARHVNDFSKEPTGLAFQPAVPAFDAFPRELWSRLLKNAAARSGAPILDYSHVGGYAPLRSELASYLGASRGVACAPEQVIVVTSTRAAVALAAAVLWRGRGRVAVEDPGYKVVQNVLRAAGHPLLHVPVDGKGMQIEQLLSASEPCSGVYVTPAHHWPTGRTLSAGRRLALLDWAVRKGAWVIEDDYDSEFRFDSPPVATLHSYGVARVVYVGTFSKTFAPSIRTAYLVLPRELVAEAERRVFLQGAEPALHVQAALAELLRTGRFGRHVARMRKLYARRRALLVGALRSVFGDRLPIDAAPGGLQLMAGLPERVSDLEVQRRAAAAGLFVRPLSNWSDTRPCPNALQLGFAAVPDAEIEPCVVRLHAAVADLL